MTPPPTGIFLNHWGCCGRKLWGKVCVGKLQKKGEKGSSNRPEWEKSMEYPIQVGSGIKVLGEGKLK